ncbi:MAG: hypothetical protein IT430_14790 [Phycisphaerales bacterium]|nr:hypothetical protein [Phycisphaerales bacterium]
MSRQFTETIRSVAMKPLIALLVTVIIIAAIVALVMFFRTGSKEGPAPAVGDATEISASLGRLLGRSTATDDCFVIIKEKSSDKFVQFSGSVEEPLLLNLPAQSLSAAERGRAEALFKTLDAQADLIEDSFYVNFDRDATAASAAAIAVFREVYQLPEEIELTITEE